MAAIFKCLAFLEASAEEDGSDFSEKKRSAGTYTDEEAVAKTFVETLRTSSRNQGKLRDELSSIVSATGLTENMAERILGGVTEIIQRGFGTGSAMARAIREAEVVVEEFAKQHPFYSALIAAGTIIAVGVLVVYAPVWILDALGFAARGPRIGSFAARWMSAIAKQYGGAARGSIYAYLQRLGMVWKRVDT